MWDFASLLAIAISLSHNQQNQVDMVCGLDGSDGGYAVPGSEGPTCLFCSYSVSSQDAAWRLDRIV